MSLALSLVFSAGAYALESAHINLGRWNQTQLEQLVLAAKELKDPGSRIAFLSGSFLNTPYREKSLIGSPEQKEVLVLDLAGVDCFTLLDYIESMRLSGRFSDLLDKLQQVRYRDGQLSYRQRNHFFSDWPLAGRDNIVDMTTEIGGGRAVTVSKQLNLRPDGSLWLPEIPVVTRRLSYIPFERVDRQVLDALHNGDYLGIYSELAGLDVSHTGIVIRTADGVWLRHASSQQRFRRVVDTDLLDYLEGKPGILIYRGR